MLKHSLIFRIEQNIKVKMVYVCKVSYGVLGSGVVMYCPIKSMSAVRAGGVIGDVVEMYCFIKSM